MRFSDSRSLARKLAQIVSEPIFDIAWLVEAALHQCSDSILCGRSPKRSDARVPPGTELDIRRQAGVDQTLSLSDRPFVELGDPGRERFNERIQLDVRQGTINAPVSLG